MAQRDEGALFQGARSRMPRLPHLPLLQVTPQISSTMKATSRVAHRLQTLQPLLITQCCRDVIGLASVHCVAHVVLLNFNQPQRPFKYLAAFVVCPAFSNIGVVDMQTQAKNNRPEDHVLRLRVLEEAGAAIVCGDGALHLSMSVLEATQGICQ